MSITRNNAADLGLDTGGVNPYQPTYNVNSGSNFLVFGSFDGTSNNGLSVKFNGISGTVVDLELSGRAAHDGFVLSPTPGSHTFELDFVTSPDHVQAAVADYAGVKQTGQPDAHNSTHNNGFLTSLSVTITIVADNSWVFAIARENNGVTVTWTGLIELIATPSGLHIADSNGPIAAGTYTVTAATAGISLDSLLVFSFSPDTGAIASPFNGAVFENPNPKRVVKDKSYNSPFPINLYGKDTFFGAPGQAPEYTLDKPTKLRSNSRLNYEINTNLGLYFPVTPFIVYEDTRPRRRKTNTLNFESNLDLDLITVSVVPFVAYDVDRKFLRRNRNLDWISNTDINLFSVANPFLVTEVTIPRRLLRQFRDFNAPINLNLLGKDTFFGAPGQAPLFDLKNPNTHRSNARLSFEVPITLFNRIPPTPVDDTTALLLFANLHIRLDVKREMDSGNVDALASDVGGTPVTFNKAFLDVDSITLTVAATQPITAIYDFVDVPNPTGFTVYAYDSSGNRVNFTVSWKARGIV